MGVSRWFILAVLFVARFGLGFQFQSAGSTAPFIVEAFAVDYTKIGTLIGLYMVPGLVLAVPSGFIGKRFGDKRSVLAGLVLMIVGGAISGGADSYAMVAAGRLVSGAGAAFLFVLMTKMLTDWFADKELFLGMSIFILGWPIGIAAGQAAQGAIAEQANWQLVFYLTSIVLAAGLVAIAAWYRAPPAHADTGPPSRGGLSGAELWLVNIAGAIWMLVNGAYLVVLSFGPTLLLERQVSIAEAGVVVSLMSWVFLIFLPLGGYLASRYKAPNIVLVGGLVGGAVAGLAIPFVGLPYLTFVAFGIGVAIAAPVMAALPAEILRAENRGPGLGIYYLWYYAGSAFIPVLGGGLKDATGSATAPMLFAAAMMLGCLCLLGLLRVEQARLARADS